MNLMTPVQPIFEQNRDKTAIINQQGKSITFGEFDSLVGRATYLLEKEGVGPGTKVLLLVPVDIELYILIAAIFKLGGIVIFIDPWAGKSYMNAALDKVKPDLMISVPKSMILSLFVKKLREIPRTIYLGELMYKVETTNDCPVKIAEVADFHSALLTFTTGSSNNPKGFDRTHGFLRAQHEAHETYFQHSSDDVDLCMFPVFVLSNLGSGMTSVLADVDLRKIASVDPQRLIDQIRTRKVTSLTCSPALVAPLAEFCLEKGVKLPEMKKFYTGGAPVDPLLFEKLENVFTEATMTLIYGSTESEPIAVMDSKEVVRLTKEMAHKGKGVALGRVVDQLQYRLIPVTDECLDTITEVPDGEVGEVILTGEFVGKRYYQDEEAFRQNKIVDKDGEIWHRTGDLAYQGEDGILFMVGRKHGQLREGDREFFPLNIEPVIDQLPCITRAAYFQYSESETALLLEKKNSANDQLCLEQVRKILEEKDMRPRFIRFVDSIPLDKRHNAKIDYRAIKEKYGEKSMSVSKEDFYGKRILAYTQERFPLVAILLFVALFCLNSFYLAQQVALGGVGSYFGPQMLFSLLTIFLVFFHLRLLDEFKDYEDDCKAYPERLLSRGVVTLKDLGTLAAVFIGLEFLFNVGFGFKAAGLAVGVIVYSLLMFKEFFISEALKKSLFAYLVSHQLILPVMIIYAFYMAVQDSIFSQTSNPAFWLALGAVTLPSTIYELARKTWSEDREHETADSYTKVWGVKGASAALILLYMVFYGLASLLGRSLKMNMWGMGLLLVITLFGMVTTLVFMTNPTNKNSKLVEAGGSVGLLGFHLAMILGVVLS